MILTEKMYDVVSDVDLIYNEFFKDYVDNIDKYTNDRNFISKLESLQPITIGTIKSDQLQSLDCIKADLANPVEIIGGIGLRNGSFYQPSKKLIQISVVRDAILYLIDPKPYDHLDSNVKKNLSNEFTAARIKGTIDHELIHWVDDTTNKYFLTNIINMASEFGKPELKLLGKEDVNLTYFEIQGQMGNIRQLKREHDSDWDNMTLEDVFGMIPSLGSINRKISINYSSRVRDLWQRNLLKRMNREGLLGKRMRNFVKKI